MEYETVDERIERDKVEYQQERGSGKRSYTPPRILAEMNMSVRACPYTLAEIAREQKKLSNPYWSTARITAVIATLSLIAWPWMTVILGDMTIFDPRLIFGVCVSGIVAVVSGSIASIKSEGGEA